jgi:hypothetical protein
MAAPQPGTAHLIPAADLVAGSMASFQLVYEAIEPIQPGGGIQISTDSDTDWGIPQFDDPQQPEYMTVHGPDGIQLSAVTVGVRGVRVQLSGRSLEAGEQLVVQWGDRSGGSLGSRVQTFQEPLRFFTVDVDLRGDGQWQPLADPPQLSVVGGAAVAMKVVAPSQVTCAEPLRLIIKVQDAWGNPARGFSGKIDLQGDGLEDLQVEICEQDEGVYHLEGVVIVVPGVVRIHARVEEQGFSAISNPIQVVESQQSMRLFWADPHGGQVVLNSKIEDFYRYARDVAGVHFVGYQRNADVISPEDWRVQQQLEKDLYQQGLFVPVPGFEWSGRTSQGGHHNVYFRNHDQPVRRNRPAETPESVDEETELEHSQDLFDCYRGKDVIITPHVGGEHSDLSFHDPTLEPAVEITSTHGSFEWMLQDVIGRGYQLGFLGGSDCYTGRPGDDSPGYQVRRYAKGGLTGIYCHDVSLESFFEAMRAKRVYATTGPRMIVALSGDGHWMGESYSTTDPPSITASVEATAPLESVQLYRGLEKVHECQLVDGVEHDQLRILFNGSSRKTSYSGVVWDGRLEVDGARIESIETIRFESPRSSVTEQSDRHLRWTAWGCGYPMAIVLRLDDPAEARFTLSARSQVITGPGYGGHGEGSPRRISLADAERVSIQLAASDLEAGELTLEMGTLDRQIQLSWLPRCEALSASLDWTDNDPLPGVQPYWLRVVQSDQEMAWSSPVFVEVRG